MEPTGHKGLPVVRRCIRRGLLFAENAAAKDRTLVLLR